MDLLIPSVLGIGLVLAILSAALPFSLEIEAMRRIPSGTFGVMMSLEPAIAAITGLVILAQSVTPVEALAIALVIIASTGAVRSASAPSGGAVQP
jgi:inner membrane transporter RhtA